MARKGEDGLTDKQRTFANEYIRTKNAEASARAAGCSGRSAHGNACNWLNPNTFPLVVRYINDRIALQELKRERTNTDILAYLHAVMFFQPLLYFRPGDRGGWLIDEEGFKKLPIEVGCLIEEVEVRRTVIKYAGNVERDETVYWVKLVSKTTAMSLAARHQLGTKITGMMGHVHVNWNDLGARSEARSEDSIEEKIRQVVGLDAQPLLENTAPTTIDSNIHTNGDGSK